MCQHYFQNHFIKFFHLKFDKKENAKIKNADTIQMIITAFQPAFSETAPKPYDDKAQPRCAAELRIPLTLEVQEYFENLTGTNEIIR